MHARSRLQAELERELADIEASLLLRLLRARTRELTIGDLFAVLAAPSGRCLEARRVAELAGEEVAVEPSGEAPMRALFAAIRRAHRPASASELCDAAGCSRAQGEPRLDALVAVGLVEALGGEPPLRYRVAADRACIPTTPVLVLAATVLTSLRTAGRAMQQMELRRVTGGTEERVRRALQHLKRARLVTSAGRNSGTRYSLVDGGASATH